MDAHRARGDTHSDGRVEARPCACPSGVTAIRHTLDVARANGCVLEMILKDTHTCEHHGERFDAWTRIAREEIRIVTGE